MREPGHTACLAALVRGEGLCFDLCCAFLESEPVCLFVKAGMTGFLSSAAGAWRLPRTPAP